MKNQILDQLIILRRTDKFTNKEWKERGLNISEDIVIVQMRTDVNKLLDKMIKYHNSADAGKKSKNVFLKNIKKINKSYYDTEELDFIADWLICISNCLNLKIRNKITEWRYGLIIGKLILLSKKNYNS